MKMAEFEKLVEAAVADLPEFFREKMANVVITVEYNPPPMRSRGETLLGLYEGIPLSQRGVWYAGAMPDKITLFKRPLETGCKTPEEMRARVRHTVMHEIAHHFGISDEELLDKGLY